MAAVLQAFLPGPHGGTALAEALIGAHNPSGRLPVSWPGQPGPILYPYWHAVSSQCNGLTNCGVRWSFGHGLSYSSIDYTIPSLTRMTVRRGDTSTLSMFVTNLRGPPVNHSVLLFASRSYRRVTPEAKRLVGFVKIELMQGASREVRFDLTQRELGYVGLQDAWTLESGTVKLSVEGVDCHATPSHCPKIEVVGDCSGVSCAAPSIFGPPRTEARSALLPAGTALLGLVLGIGATTCWFWKARSLARRPTGRAQVVGTQLGAQNVNEMQTRARQFQKMAEDRPGAQQTARA